VRLDSPGDGSRLKGGDSSREPLGDSGAYPLRAPVTRAVVALRSMAALSAAALTIPRDR